MSNIFTPRTTVRVKHLQHASRQLEVVPVDPAAGRYIVESASHAGQSYEVVLEPGAMTGRCTCAWAAHGGINCKHVLAALRAHYAEQGNLSFWPNQADARRQHRRLVEGQHLYATLRPRRTN